MNTIEAAVCISLILMVMIGAGGIRFTVRRTKEGDPKSGFGRPCSWCDGIKPDNHNADCPLTRRDIQ
jgi:hypothetical protein